MPFSVSLLLDQKPSEVIADLWHLLAEMQISRSPFRSNYRPPVTPEIAGRLDLEPFQDYL